jgi:amidase
VLGFRPSHGAVSTDGVWPLAPRFDTVGWFARDPDVLARVGSVLLETAPRDATLVPQLLLFPGDVESGLDPSAFRAFVRGAGAVARRLGRSLSPVTVGDRRAPLSSWLPTYLALQNLEAAATHRSWIERERPAFGSLIAGRLARALAATADDGAKAHARVSALHARADALLGPGAWLLWPSSAGAAPALGLPDDVVDAITGRALTLAALASLTGLPQISLPLSEADGCPFGVSLIGPRGADRALLAVAAVVLGATSEGSS